MAEKFKKGFAADEFKYKNCYNGVNLLYPDKTPDLVIHFKKGDELPDELTKRKMMKNPTHVVFKKPKEVADNEAEALEKPKEEHTGKVFSKSELIELTKEKQLELLKQKGVPEEELNKLAKAKEKDRVKKLLELNPE